MQSVSASDSAGQFFTGFSDRRFKHGHSKKPEYQIWKGMRQRCSNPNNEFFADYGGRGISVCAAWQDSVEAFLADMGSRPTVRHSLDRIDNDGDYEPSNCRWATKKQQSSNQRKNVFVMVGDERVTLSEAARRLGINLNTVFGRLRAGWDVNRALAQAARPWGR